MSLDSDLTIGPKFEDYQASTKWTESAGDHLPSGSRGPVAACEG